MVSHSHRRPLLYAALLQYEPFFYNLACWIQIWYHGRCLWNVLYNRKILILRDVFKFVLLVINSLNVLDHVALFRSLWNAGRSSLRKFNWKETDIYSCKLLYAQRMLACSCALREYIVAYLVPRRDWRPRKKLVTILYINLRTIIDYIHRLRLQTRLNLRILFFGAKTNPGGDRVTFQLASSLSRRLKITNSKRIGTFPCSKIRCKNRLIAHPFLFTFAILWKI